MTGRITSEVVNIIEVGEEPAMDSARIAGTAVLDDERWEFRTRKEDFESGDEIRAIVERTENEEGRFLRIHETLEDRNNR